MGYELRLSTGEAAAAVGVKRRTMTLWITTGKVKSSRTPGGHYRVPQSEIDRLLAEVGGPEQVAS